MKENIILPKVIKIGILGDQEVGKTSICYFFTGIEFVEGLNATSSYDKYEKKIKLTNDKEIKVVLLDTCGARNRRSLVFKVLRYCTGIILVFGFSRRQSFDDLNDWIDDIKDNFNDPFIILFGNYADLDKDEWKITSEEVNKFVKEKGIPYFEVSAKTGKGIEEGITFIANEIYKKLLEEDNYNSEIIINKNDKIKEKKKSDCVRNKKNKK